MSPQLILLVEDDLNLRQSIALILERAGYIVDATDCPYKAMDLINSRKYNLLISDINIPETRKMLLQNVLGIYPYISIFVLTDQASERPNGEDRLLSAQYLVKPIAPERLLDCVGMILEQKKNINNNTIGNRPLNPN